MACDKCVRKFDREYRAELRKLSPARRLGRAGQQLQGRYKALMGGVCKHQI